jgi:hypothetical protein
MELNVIYVVKNITHTSDDQHRRGHRLREIRKARVQIGIRSIEEGRSASFSEEMYQQYKDRIDHYVSIGMIQVTAHGAPAEATAETTSVEAPAQPEVTPEVVAEEPVAAEPSPEVVEVKVEDEVAVETSTEAPIATEEVVEDTTPKKRGRPPKEK